MNQESKKTTKRSSITGKLLVLSVTVLCGLLIYGLWQRSESNEDKQYAFYRHIADSLFEHKAYEESIKFYQSALTYMPDDRYALAQVKAAESNRNITFINTFGGVETDEGTGIATTNDGGYLLTGVTGTAKPYGWILRTDAHGQLERRETVGSGENNQLNALIPCKDGNFLAVGTTKTNSKNKLWLLKLTEQGRVLWQQIWKADTLQSGGLQVTEAPDSSIWVSGYVQVADTSQTDALLAHFSSSGEAVAYWKYGSIGADAATALAFVNDTTLALAGYMQASDTPTTDGWIALTDTSGNIIWQHIAGGNRNDLFNCIAISPNNLITVAGHSQSYGSGSMDMWLAQYNLAGTEMWSKVVEGKGNEMIRSMVSLPDNGFALSGYTTSYGQGGKDAWLLRINRNGSIAWKKEIGEAEDDVANALIITADGGFAMTGYFTKSQNPDLSIIKTDVNGNIAEPVRK